MNPEQITTWATVIGVISSILAVIHESRRSRESREVDLVLNFESRFLDERMTRHRTAAAKFLQSERRLDPHQPQWETVSEVIDFFQVLGTCARIGHVKIELVYKFFYYWLSNYWIASMPFIKRTRGNSSITWDDAQWLYDKLKAFDLKKNSGALSAPSDDDLDKFFSWEQGIAYVPAVPERPHVPEAA